MKKLNFSFALCDLSGTPLRDDFGKEVTAGKILGNNLVAGSNGDALKYYDWAVAMASGKEISVDASDFKKLRDFIENSQAMTILAKAQLLRYLDDTKAE